MPNNKNEGDPRGDFSDVDDPMLAEFQRKIMPLIRSSLLRIQPEFKNISQQDMVEKLVELFIQSLHDEHIYTGTFEDRVTLTMSLFVKWLEERGVDRQEALNFCTSLFIPIENRLKPKFD